MHQAIHTGTMPLTCLGCPFGVERTHCINAALKWECIMVFIPKMIRKNSQTSCATGLSRKMCRVVSVFAQQWHFDTKTTPLCCNWTSNGRKPFINLQAKKETFKGNTGFHTACNPSDLFRFFLTSSYADLVANTPNKSAFHTKTSPLPRCGELAPNYSIDQTSMRSHGESLPLGMEDNTPTHKSPQVTHVKPIGPVKNLAFHPLSSSISASVLSRAPHRVISIW